MGNVRCFQTLNKFCVIQIIHAAAVGQNPVNEIALVHVIDHVGRCKIKRINRVALARDLRKAVLIVFQRHNGKTRIISAIVNLSLADFRLTDNKFITALLI